MKLSIILIVAATLSGVRSYSQETARTECLSAMKEMVNKYQASSYLSFTITYKYSTEQQPETYLDSLKGSYRMNGKDYWYSLDSTEVASYQGTSVLLFKEDHIMYLLPSVATRKRSVDFLAALDSLLSYTEGMQPVMSDMPAGKTFKLSFGAGKSIRSIEYIIDKSGYIARIREVVKSDQLYDPSIRGRIEGPVPYAIVDMDFSDYRTGGFSDSQLNTAQYFRKEGENYVSIAPYDEYKIFLGAPNL